MAENKNKPIKGISTLMDTIKSTMDNIYQSTHMTSSMNKKDIEIIKNKMDNAISNISSTNYNNIGSSNLSNLLAKSNIKDQLKGNVNGKNVFKNVEDLFNDDQSMQNITYLLEENKSIIEFDQEIDIILKYFTILQETLDLKKDTVLAADNNNKDYLNFIPLNVEKEMDYDTNLKAMKTKYNLLYEIDKIYDNISRYGEEFYYLVPYKKALTKLLNSKNGSTGMNYANESSIYSSSAQQGIIEASFDLEKGKIKTNNTIQNIDEDLSNIGFDNFKVELYTNGILTEAVGEQNFIQETSVKLDKIMSRDTVIGSLTNDSLEAPDGMLDLEKTVKENDIKVNGAIFKRLKRENIIPIYIDNTALGYYYIECEFEKFAENNKTFNNPIFNKRTANGMTQYQKEQQKEQMMNRLSKTLSKFIDVNFINNNQDMADQIYMILNYNEINNNKKLSKMKVTYLPPEDVEHLYFELDPVTHRGISDLQKALIPAKLYICLYVTNALAILTRGYDKRAYYVKQSVDTNIAQSLLTVINQIKRGNFGAREISSIKNILGVTGKFQDLIIPMNATGDSPLQMEVMQGQTINTQEEFMQRLEQMAVEALDMPYEFVVQGRQQTDFATRLTMSNGKVLRKAYKRQAVVELFGSRIGTKLYNYQFGTNMNLELQLPPPTFLNITNTNQLISNVNETVQSIINMELDPDSDPLMQQIFTRKLMRHYLSTYIDGANIDRIKKEAEMEYAKLKKDEE